MTRLHMRVNWNTKKWNRYIDWESSPWRNNAQGVRRAKRTSTLGFQYGRYATHVPDEDPAWDALCSEYYGRLVDAFGDVASPSRTLALHLDGDIDDIAGNLAYFKLRVDELGQPGDEAVAKMGREIAKLT